MRLLLPSAIGPAVIGPVVIGVILASPVLAQSRAGHTPARSASRSATAAPHSIGTFDDWQAATHVEAGATVCYAFTRAHSSVPALPGRGEVVLTVTQRPSGRDAVAISAGFPYPSGAEVVVDVERTELAFYTSGRSAFARDGRAVVAAFDKGRSATAKSPAPRNATVVDTFSLRGFSGAYAAINKACPAK